MKIRVPVMLKVHDADVKEHSFGPVMVEIDDEALEKTTSVDDFWFTQNRLALEYLIPDMSCDSLAGTVWKP